MLRYLTISKFSAESGYTEAAIRSKIRDGIWAEGDVWVRAPDNRILIDVEGYVRWIEAGDPFKAHLSDRRRASKSPAPLSVSVAGGMARRGPLPLAEK
jgi:hypothetical protein